MHCAEWRLSSHARALGSALTHSADCNMPHWQMGVLLLGVRAAQGSISALGKTSCGWVEEPNPNLLLVYQPYYIYTVKRVQIGSYWTILCLVLDSEVASFTWNNWFRNLINSILTILKNLIENVNMSILLVLNLIEIRKLTTDNSIF